MREDRARLPAIGLAVAVVFSELGYVGLVELDAVNGVVPVAKFLGLMGVLFALYGIGYWLAKTPRRCSTATLWLIAGGSILFRLTLLPAGVTNRGSAGEVLESLRADLSGRAVAFERFLLFDSDIWRYLWDGHAWAHGVNPYPHPPDSASLDRLVDETAPVGVDGLPIWTDIRDNINHPSTPTIYPPLAQVAFRVAHSFAPGSVLAMKLLVVGCDLGAGLVLALILRELGRPVHEAILYLWNPLVIKAFAGSGHMDALLILALAATTFTLLRRQNRLAAACLGCSILAKLSPLVLLPFLARRTGIRNSLIAAGVVTAGYVPFADAGLGVFCGLGRFLREWQFNAGPFSLFRWLAAWGPWDPDGAARLLSGLAVASVVGWSFWRDDFQPDSFARVSALVLGATILLGPTVMPWYATWLLPLAVAARQPVWIWFSALVCSAFLVMIDGAEPAWALWLEYGALVFLSGLYFIHHHYTRRSPYEKSACSHPSGCDPARAALSDPRTGQRI